MKKWLLVFGFCATLFSLELEPPTFQILKQNPIHHAKRGVALLLVKSKFPKTKKPMYDLLDQSVDERDFYYTQGSGFLISEEGYIGTCEHVVDEAEEISVVFHYPTLQVFPAKVIGSDKRCDFALIKIEPEQATLPKPLRFVKQNSTFVGDTVFAIGNPRSKRHALTVTQGVVSHTKRIHSYNDTFAEYIQFDASVIGGNSGCPVVNNKGDVVAITSHGHGQPFAQSALNFGVPSETAKNLVVKFLKKNADEKVYIGLKLCKREKKVFDYFTFHESDGAVVDSVAENSPASVAGVQKGDRITHLNEEIIPNAASFHHHVLLRVPGDTIKLRVHRDGGEIQLKVTLKKFPEETKS